MAPEPKPEQRLANERSALKDALNYVSRTVVELRRARRKVAVARKQAAGERDAYDTADDHFKEAQRHLIGLQWQLGVRRAGLGKKKIP